MAIKSQGTEIRIGGTVVKDVNSASLGGVDVNFIDTTTWSADGGWRTFIGGLKDPGTLEISGNANPTDPGQKKLIEDVGSEVTFELVLTNGQTFSGTCIIGGYSINPSGDDAVEFSCSCKCTGPVTLGAGTPGS